MVIGVTGGIGSGKSTVLNFLRDGYRAQIIEEDQVARELMEPGGACYQAVTEAFGLEILAEDGQINRKELAALVFSDEAKRKQLNSLTHPLVEREVRRRIAAYDGLSVVETALPREAGLRCFCDTVWYVHVPDEIRIARLMQDRGYSREKCLQVMASQLSEEEFRNLSDVVIENGGAREETHQQIRDSYNIFLKQNRF